MERGGIDLAYISEESQYIPCLLGDTRPAKSSSLHVNAGLRCFLTQTRRDARGAKSSEREARILNSCSPVSDIQEACMIPAKVPPGDGNLNPGCIHLIEVSQKGISGTEFASHSDASPWRMLRMKEHEARGSSALPCTSNQGHGSNMQIRGSRRKGK